jgi:exodeoxyribonuclease V beta subunit
MSFKPFLAYSASAGSGKTFALAVRYLSLLFMGESPGTILAATFTNKAAGEMQERVVHSLRHLGEDKAFLDAVVAETGMQAEMLFEKQPEVLNRFLSSSSHIVTLDSFFAMILRSASLEIGLEPDFVTKEQPEEVLETHFLEEVDRHGALSSLVKLAMDIEDKRFKKIFTLMQHFYKVDPLLPPPVEVMLSLEKEEEACEILRTEMLKALQDAGAPDRCLKQFDTKSVKVLFGKKLFEKTSLGEHSWYKKVANPEIEALYAALKQRLLLWAKAKEMVVLHHIFSIYDYYRNAIISHAKSTGVLTFDDLTYFTYRLLHESMSKEFLYFKIDAKFKHILLDEFQDTSTLQFLLLKPLIDEIFAGQGQSELRSFFYVGDTKQSLYRFRGGVEELFDKVAEHYGVEIEQMNTNYRSSQLVVEQVNLWFADTMEGYVPQKSREGAREGYVKVFESEEPVDDAVAQAQRLLKEGIDVNAIAFLVNTNKEGQQLQEACEAVGIPTLLKTSSSLRHLPKVAAVVAMVSYLFGGNRIDAEAMLQQVGRRLEEVDLSWFSVFMSPLQVVDRLIRAFGYFDNDPNMLKLLAFASGFSDIPTFIEEFETSSISIAANSVYGAHIMTIHGSKGLEFEYVIVLDKLTRPNSDKAPLLFHYNDALYIDQILYRTANRESFDTHYARVLEERKASAEKDRMNVLYVALTRAVEGLIVVKKPEGSIFDAIHMVPVERGMLQVLPKVEEETLSQTKETENMILSYYGAQEVKERQEDDDEKDLDAILFGTALHYALEMMGRFEEPLIASALTAVRNRYGQLLSQEVLQQIENRIRRLVNDAAFQALLENAEISREQAFFFDGEIRQIDLLLAYDDHMLVIDYKSSRKYHIEHQEQVQTYRRAVEKITGKPTEGMLIYLLKEEISIENLK